MEKISWTDRVRNEEVLQIVMEERNVLRTVTRRKDKRISHILCKNRHLKSIMEGRKGGRIEERERRGRRRNEPLHDLKEKRGYCKLKEEALDGTV